MTPYRPWTSSYYLLTKLSAPLSPAGLVFFLSLALPWLPVVPQQASAQQLRIIKVSHKDKTVTIPMKPGDHWDKGMQIGPVFVEGHGDMHLRVNGRRISGDYYMLMVAEFTPGRYTFELKPQFTAEAEKASDQTQDSQNQLTIDLTGAGSYQASVSSSYVNSTRIFQYLDLLHIIEYLAAYRNGIILDEPGIVSLGNPSMMVNKTLRLASKFRGPLLVLYPGWETTRTRLIKNASPSSVQVPTFTCSRFNPYLGCVFGPDGISRNHHPSKYTFHFAQKGQSSFVVTAVSVNESKTNPQTERMLQQVEHLLLPSAADACAALEVCLSEGNVSAALLDQHGERVLAHESRVNPESIDFNLLPDEKSSDANSYVPSYRNCISFLNKFLQNPETTHLPPSQALVCRETSGRGYFYTPGYLSVSYTRVKRAKSVQTGSGTSQPALPDLSSLSVSRRVSPPKLIVTPVSGGAASPATIKKLPHRNSSLFSISLGSTPQGPEKTRPNPPTDKAFLMVPPGRGRRKN